MQHLLRPLAIGNESRLREATNPVMKPSLAWRIVGVVALVAASLAAIADQSDKFVSAHEIVGLHEIPSFVADRVELTPGLSADRLEPTPGLSVDGPIGGPAPADPPTGNRMGQS